MRLGKLGVDRDRVAIFSDRLLHLAPHQQKVRQIVMRLSMLRIELHCPVMGRDRFVVTPHPGQNQAEALMKIRMIRIDGDGASNQFRGILVPAGLVFDDSQEMQRIGMVRLLGKNLPVNRLRVAGASGLMVTEAGL